jgi:hypothetical protein
LIQTTTMTQVVNTFGKCNKNIVILQKIHR